MSQSKKNATKKAAKGATKPPAEAKGTTKAKGGAQAKAAKAKRASAINVAAAVLKAEGKPMGCRALIETMAARGLWTSPGGRTPEATLYAAIVREIAAKGKNSRFRKVERGLFAATGQEA